jgi:hypothetical protein
MSPTITEIGKHYQLIDADTGEAMSKRHRTRFACYREWYKQQEATRNADNN